MTSGRQTHVRRWGMSLADVAMLLGLLVGVVLFFVVVIVGVMRYEQRRESRAAARLAAGLDDARSTESAGPGRWSLTAIDGRRAGCDVSLRPQVLGNATIKVGTSRFKAMGVRLAIRGSREIGTGALEVRGRALVVTGTLAPIEPDVERALIACSASLELEGREARVDHALPISNDTIDQMLAVVDAIAPYLAPREQDQRSTS